MKTNILILRVVRSIRHHPLRAKIKLCLVFAILSSSFFLFPTISKCQSDTLICYNGGFESNFTYYFGKTANFTTGSNNCSPLAGGNPVSWSNSALSSFRQFEITSSGVDTLVGIARTKFGSKAALINNRYTSFGFTLLWSFRRQ
jgi:hypothetical protein